MIHFNQTLVNDLKDLTNLIVIHVGLSHPLYIQSMVTSRYNSTEIVGYLTEKDNSHINTKKVKSLEKVLILENNLLFKVNPNIDMYLFF